MNSGTARKPGQAAGRLPAMEMLLVAAVFAVCLAGAVLVPMSACPDERGRALLSDYMYTTGRLPAGGEAEVMVRSWGFSYALRPYLPAMIGALFMRAASWLGLPAAALLPASRMCSVLSVPLCCLFCLRLGRLLFRKRSSALTLAVFVCLMPQTLFLGMYQNNDALSLAAVTMLVYTLVRGYEARFSWKSCAGIAAAASLVLLSYYSAYAWLLFGALFCLAAVALDARIAHKLRFIAGRAALIAGLCAVLAGWFFIRNALLHQGDLLGLTEEGRQRAELLAQGAALAEYRPMFDGFPTLAGKIQRLREWLMFTARSLIGVFGYMTVYLPLPRYGLYYAAFALAALSYLAAAARRRPSRRDALLMALALLAGAATVGLSLLQSLLRDYQPQGRYVITVLLTFGLMLACGMDALELPEAPPACGRVRRLLRRLLQPGLLPVWYLLALSVRTGLGFLV